MEFIYWRHPSVPGIKIEEISGGDHYSGNTWREMAKQLYGENGRDEYREIGHYHNGSPFLYGDNSRISLTHCKGLLVVATLPSTPEINLAEFNPHTCMGVDAERMDRKQVLEIRERFLNDSELQKIRPDDIRANIHAWTIKEAAYKAMLTPGLDLRKQIIIETPGSIGPATPVFDPLEYGLPKNQKNLPDEFFGEVRIISDEERVFRMKSYSWESDECIVTLCYSPECIRFGNH